jgi:hypothetical protein
MSLETEIKDFDRSMVALQLELPDIVWRDVWRRWMDLRRIIAAPVTLDECAQIDGDVCGA